MIICDSSTISRVKPTHPLLHQLEDIIDLGKFNSLPSPVTARILSGAEYWIETLDVQTGLMKIDVCGQVDLTSFAEVLMLIDADGIEHNPDDFWMD